ncbi:hypothetical protein VTJ49DRAFT_7558 [Mycothermus thermophilus]|uniref:Protein YOP1 n=1 Tax=Humicola insolens TaxID=85995 RepID=A0ABR3VGM6_HUMIN
MFDLVPNLLSSVASFLFPVFASYKALKTSDPAQLTPWLMYWVILAFVVLFESWTSWILFWVPFYAYIRLLFLLYLVLPQTQGARFLYETYVHPRLEENETAIEEFIASAHTRLRSAGISYLKRAIELLRTNVLGLPPSPEAREQAAPEPQSPQSYTQALLARFALPTPPWATTAGAAPQGTTTTYATDLYRHIASAIAAATTTPSTTTKPPAATPTPATATTTTSLIPDSVLAAGTAARALFIRNLREQLSTTMSALDREEAAAAAGEDASASLRSDNNNKDDNGKRRSLSEQSVASGLSKSRSEGDFEKLDAPSGEEEEEGQGLRRRGIGRKETGEKSGGGWIW